MGAVNAAVRRNGCLWTKCIAAGLLAIPGGILLFFFVIYEDSRAINRNQAPIRPT